MASIPPDSAPPDSTSSFDADWGSLESERSPKAEARPASARRPPLSDRSALLPPVLGDVSSMPPLGEEAHQRDTMPPPVPLTEMVEQMMRETDSEYPRSRSPGEPSHPEESGEIERGSDDLTRPFNRSDIPAVFPEIGLEPLRAAKVPDIPGPHGLAAEHELLHAELSGATSDPRLRGFEGAGTVPPTSFGNRPLGLPGAPEAGETRKARTAPLPFLRPQVAQQYPESEPPGVLRPGPAFRVPPPPPRVPDELDDLQGSLDDLEMDDAVSASQRSPSAPAPQRLRLPSPPPVSAPFGRQGTAPFPAVLAPLPPRAQATPEPRRSESPSRPIARIRVTPSPGPSPVRSLTPAPTSSRKPWRSPTPPPGSDRLTPALTPPPSSPPSVRSAAGLRLGGGSTPAVQVPSPWAETRAAEPARSPMRAPPVASPDPIERMQKRVEAGDYGGAMMIAEDILANDPGNVLARRCVESCREMVAQKYLSRLGSKSHVLHVSVPPEELRWLSLDHRAGFLLSFVDGAMSIEEVLDVAGMAELDALRILHELREQGVIDVVAPAARSGRR